DILVEAELLEEAIEGSIGRKAEHGLSGEISKEAATRHFIKYGRHRAFFEHQHLAAGLGGTGGEEKPAELVADHDEVVIVPKLHLLFSLVFERGHAGAFGFAHHDWRGE